jgi:hypothetical protein
MGVVGLFFAAMILACCIRPARSPAEERNRMFATANRTFGTAIAATTITTNTTIKISIRLNPQERARRRLFLLTSILILVSNSLLGAYCRGLFRTYPNFRQYENSTLHATS